jgi:DNA invertase Pin-like site-specific DNA recombinase
MLNILVSFSQFEKVLIAERVRAGMQRAKKQGKSLGRPRLTVPGTWSQVRQQIVSGELSRREAAKILGIGRSSVLRLMRCAT